MLNLKKSLLAGTFAMGMLAQTASANFYVIPVGQSTIPASAVKSIMAPNVSKGNTSIVYTVPEGKAFVLKEYQMIGAYGEIIVGDYYTSSVTPRKFDLGIVLQSGETISLRNTYTGTSTYPLSIFINGYETRP